MDSSELERDHVEEEEGNHHARHHDPSGYNDEEDDRSHPFTGDGASLGKIFVGGLARETTTDQFVSHFERYGEITDSVIMKDRTTGHPRGFGFITYADPSVVDRVIEDTHIINGKQVEIKRTIPKGVKSRDFKTKKIFVGGIPTTVTEEEFKEFFSEFGDVKEHQIMRDHNTNRSRGFGFITFVKDEHVDNLLSRGNRIDFAGVQVEIKKAEPRKPNALPSLRRYNDTRSTYGGGFRDSYGGYGGDSGGFGPSSYRAGGGAYGGRSAAAAAVGYGGFGGGGFGAYGAYGASMMGGPYRGAVASSYGYMNRYGAGGYGRGSYDMSSGGGYGAASSDGYGSYGAAMGGTGAFGGGYDSALGGGYGGGGGPMYGSSRGGAYGGGGAGAGSGRYHPYGR